MISLATVPKSFKEKEEVMAKCLKGCGLCLASGAAFSSGFYVIAVGLFVAGMTILVTEK